MWHKYFSPRFFLNIADKILPFLVVIFLSCFGYGLYLALFNSPPDYQQGEAVRIMYIHVPSAWMSLAIYSFMAIFAIAGFVWKNPLSFMMMTSSFGIGAIFTLITLVTGSLWGKPIWGAWWVWDARLTSVLILFFFYISAIILYKSFDNIERAEKAAAILILVGFINVPIVKFSVDIWNSLHQPASILRKGGASIHHSMLLPLFLIFVSFLCYYVIFMLISLKNSIIIRKNNLLR